VVIRNRIIHSLQNYPKNIDQVRKDLEISHATAQRHLNYLRDIGAVRVSSFKTVSGEMQLFELVRGKR